MSRGWCLGRTPSAVAATIAALSLGACATVVVPPAAPGQAEAVYLLDHGRHSSLVLPAADGGMVRYEYGDWAYFALNERGARAVSGALFGPSTAALGRQRLPGPASAFAVRRHVRVSIENLYVLEVEREGVRTLRERLDAIHESAGEKPVYNPRYELEFVRHPDAYSASRNSNSMVADWLQSLGCRVAGWKLWASWDIRPPRPLRSNGREPSRPQG
ncbi:MAG: DUF2459 domain-containing protein [Gammaproteobacteria bacterium]|nr:DUF2459 domain-containing protein [Gammaproteobacteria bacterium]